MEMARADLHCHSSASQRSRLGVQRALGLPECATPPPEVYDLAKRRGMDFVTITSQAPAARKTAACGAQGSAEKWTHAAMALAVRALGRGGAGPAPDPRAVFTMVERVMSQGRARSGPLAADLGPSDARALLRAWLDSVGLDMSEQELLASMQEDDFSHAAL